MTELEKKLLLTEDEYDYLMEHLGYESPLIQKPITTQVNYYFDTDDLSMNRQNITCRIRLKDGKYKGTIKRHAPNGDYSTETEIEIYDGLTDNQFTAMGLKLQGTLTTERHVIRKNASFEIVLDKNDYLDHTDYELEIEYNLKHKKDAQEMLAILCDILTSKKLLLADQDSSSFSSKSGRFFERKAAIAPIRVKSNTTEGEKT